MLFDGRIYSVLIVSASEKFNSLAAKLFPESEYYPVSYVSSVAEAKRSMLDRPYDIILLNSPLPDDIGTRFAIDVCNDTYSIILMVVKNDMYDEIYVKSYDQGVFTISKPTSQQTMTHTIKLMAAARERLRRFEKTTLTLEEKMEEIRVVNRAKWKLIEEKTMTEQEAHRYIEKLAMDKCVARKQIAQDIIDGADLCGTE